MVRRIAPAAKAGCESAHYDPDRAFQTDLPIAALA